MLPSIICIAFLAALSANQSNLFCGYLYQFRPKQFLLSPTYSQHNGDQHFIPYNASYIWGHLNARMITIIISKFNQRKMNIPIAFISSTQARSISEHVCIDLSDCRGWNAVLKLTLLPNTFCKLYKNWDKNLESLSDTMLTGMEHHVALQSLEYIG